jgi:hypothetical protein
MNNETKVLAFLIADIQCLHKKMEVLRAVGMSNHEDDIKTNDLYWYSQLLDLQFMATDAVRNARMEISKSELTKLDKALGTGS